MAEERIGMERQEHALVLEARRGDAAAFDRLARMHEDRILRVLQGILGDGDDMYDAWQETLVRAFLRLGSFRFESAFSTWLTRIAINQALNARKRIVRVRAEPLDPDAGVPADEVLSSIERDEIRRAIDAALGSLSDRERTVFVLRHHHDYRLREIAEMLDCAEGTVKNYLFRAIRKMRHALEPRYREFQSA